MADFSQTNKNSISNSSIVHQHHNPAADDPFQPSSAASMMHPSSGNKEPRIGHGDEGQEFFLYLYDQQRNSAPHFLQESDQMRPPTLSMFPSLPMHEDQEPSKVSNSLNFGAGGGGGGYGTSENLFDGPSVAHGYKNRRNSDEPLAKHGENKQQFTGQSSSSEQDHRKLPDAKTMRRLAQNREAARKSRIRKKAYIQQLETSKMKLVQLEQELHRARSSQGGSFNGGFAGDQPNLSMGLSLSSDAVIFDMEYRRWLEQQSKLTSELRAAFLEQLPDNEMRLFVHNWLGHFDQLIHLKAMMAKSDSFHLLSGSWKSPAERCFLWIGGFRPSHLIKIISKQIGELADAQVMAMYELESSTLQGEDALSNGLEALNQSLTSTIASDSLTSQLNDMNNYMGQMAIAISKLSTLEGFIRQADNLRQQVFHRLHQILTIRQSARCFLAISEYFHSLRAVSSLWLARPRQE